MNILYLIAVYGPEYMAGEIHRELGRELASLGHGFSVLAFESEAGRREREGRRGAWDDDGFPVYRRVTAGLPGIDLLNRLARPLLKYERFLPAERALSRHLRDHPEVDLVLAEGAYPFGAIAASACTRHSIPFVVTVAGGDFISSHAVRYGYGRFRFPRYAVKRVLARAAAIRATTPLVREEVVALGGNPEKTFVVPRNVAGALFQSPQLSAADLRSRARAEVEKRWGPLPGPFLACAGRLLPIKGFGHAIRALAQLPSEFRSARLLVAGPDRAGHLDELRKMAAEHNVSEAVIFPGPLSTQELRTVLAAADLALVPSILEGMNKVAVEAGALGTPSIITRTTGIAEPLGKAGAGLLVEPEDAAGLAGAVATLLRDPARRAEMGRAGVAFAAGFHPARIAADLQALFARAMGSLDEARVAIPPTA